MAGYSIRESPRAKNVYLKLSLKEGLVVVVPRGFDCRRVPALVAGKQGWIARSEARLRAQALAPPPPLELPDFIRLNAIGRSWPVEYDQTSAASSSARERGGRLVVAGSLQSDRQCVAALERWLTRQAHRQLTPWLERVSGSLGLPFGKVSVRNQRSRWASCSARHTISLNQKLLFLPPHLVEYIFVHELCHTVHLNHSRRFWRLVAQHEPECRRWDVELRRGWQYVPGWACL